VSAWSGRVLAGLGVVGLMAAVGGCAKPATLHGCPAPVPTKAFAYKPVERRAPSEVRAPDTRAAAPLAAVPGFLDPAVPPHDAGWEAAGPERPWRWIVIHHSATDRGSAAAFDADHRNRRHWDELGYHFVIGNGGGSGDGHIEVGSRWPKQKHGAHCRVGDDQRYNEFGIGICLVGDFERRRPSEAQMRALVRLVDYLSTRYGVAESRILGHGMVDDTKCPGRYFSFADLFGRLRAARAGREAVATAE